MANQLTQKQETFCVKYFELGNASEAARIAGYSPKWAGVNTCQILRRPSIQARIKELREKEGQTRQDIGMEAVMSVIERQQKLSIIGRADLTKFIDGEGNIDTEKENTEAIAEISVKDWRGVKGGVASSRTKTIKLHSSIQAIDLLNKMDKLYSDGYQDNRVVNRTVNIYVVDQETKDLIEHVGDRTEVLVNGRKDDKGIQDHSTSVDRREETG